MPALELPVLRRLTLSFLLILMTLLIAGCGGDTSWYVCSGTGDFCGGDRNDDDEEDKPLTISALEVARKTPQLIDQGLQLDGLRETTSQQPELISGWLLAGSLGLLVDDSDNASASRFYDDTRYWLMTDQVLAVDDVLLGSGLRLLAVVSTQRDPAVASAALQALKSPAVVVTTADSALARSTAQQVLRDADADRCCETDELMAAAVLLCDDLEVVTDLTVAACSSASNWLLDASP